MTNKDTLASQNLKLLQAIHTEIPFLRKFSSQQLGQLVPKSHFFVFSHGTVIAQQKQPIDFIAVILQGKIAISGQDEKYGAGYFIGELGFCGILDKHATCVTGDSDGIVMAIKLEDIQKMGRDVREVINGFCVGRSLDILKGQSQGELTYVPEEIQERKVSHLFSPTLKVLLNQTLDQKQKQNLFKFFPIFHLTSKTRIIQKKQQPFLLAVIKGQLLIKSQSPTSPDPQKLLIGQFYNTQGFLLNYSPSVNIYCLSQQAVVLRIHRRVMVNVLDMGTVQKIDNYLLRKEVNEKKYDVVTSEVRREREKMMAKSGTANSKWTVFTKQNYQIIPLAMPKKVDKDKQKQKPAGDSQQKQQFVSTLFREQQQSKNQKTGASTNSKINKIITMKTQKAQQKTNTLEQQVKDLRKETEILSSKLKYYQDNFNKCNLEMIEYKTKYHMGAVLKEINELGDKKFRGKTGGELGNVMTLKKAFQEHMRENKIREVVARCAYKWLWLVRKRKGWNKGRSTVK